MLLVQKMLWPVDGESLGNGLPAPLTLSADFESVLLDDEVLHSPQLLSRMWSNGVQSLIDKAVDLGIDQVEDIISCIVLFKQLNWCSIAVLLLR